jgi:hypothetical protein
LILGEKIEAIISSKLKGEAVQMEEKRPNKPAAKNIWRFRRDSGIL